MTTSTSPAASSDQIARVPLRLRMTEHPGRATTDGAWWPQSRDLAVELADLVDHFPAGSGRVARALVSPPDWDETPRIVPVAGRRVKVGSFPRDDTHLINLTTGDRTILHVVVLPPSLTQEQADEVLRAASDGAGSQTATELLRRVGWLG